ncbi:hypothetical protein [Coraliomargarita parva]|uniref:hypothetical protein n=1 Tax=Coraliomargarita parva TaxID=3014050 RepID=UPI0022B44678|nr:hypothetical protein [Coraliomargarita parva]
MDELDNFAKAGVYTFILLCGLLPLEANGFGFGLPVTPASALMCSCVGGLVGGGLICRNPLVAGLIGGLIAGPSSYFAVSILAQNFDTLYTLAIVLVQGLSTLPGVGVALLLKKLLLKTESSAA